MIHYRSLDYCKNVAIIVGGFKNYIRKYKKIDISNRFIERHGYYYGISDYFRRFL